jgi:hypothetical protein
MALKSNGVTQVPDGLGSANQVLKVNSAGTAGEWGTITSGDLTEGSTNLFFTDARADARVALLVDSAPSTLDTLNELASALGDDANFSTTVTNSIATKLPLAGGTLTGGLTVQSGAVIINNSGGNSQIYLGGTGGSNMMYLSRWGNDTLLWNADSGVMRFGTNNSEAMRIDSSGNVGIGTSTFGTNGKLQVAGGIGLTGNSEIRQSTNADGNTLRFLGTQFVAGVANSHSYSYTDGALIAARAANANAILFDVGTTSTSGHKLKVLNDGTGVSGSLQYLHGSDTRFIVKSLTGNVGIGTTDPQDKLHISGVSENIRVHNTGTGNYGLEIWRGSNKGASFAWGEGNANLEIKNYRNDSQPDGPYANIDFFTGGTNANASGSPAYSPELRMRIQQTGEVGIGTSNPTAELHVVGDATVTGNITKGSGVKYEPEYQGYVLTNDNDYKLLARISSGSGYCGACEFNLAGTTNSTVFQTVGVASANHSYDGSILTHVTSHYSGVKIKIVSNGNNEFELYVAVNTAGSNNVGISYTIRKVNGNVTMAPSSAAYSSGYLVHTAGNNTITTSASMPSGSGPTAF